MSLTLYYHPLSSFCWKPLIALYEAAIPFAPTLVDLGDEQSRENFYKVWPMGQFPVLRDEFRERTIPQSAAVIEYLDLYHGGTMIPADPDQALEARRWDSFYDCYLQHPMQKIVADSMRSPEQSDALGVQQARQTLSRAYGVLEDLLNQREWTTGSAFTLADCAAAPALFYANKIQPFGESEQRLSAFLRRLQERSSIARVLEEAAPYLDSFPYQHSENESEQE
ncbi:glutathione S-transferase family protein [Gilvimarinus sp. F26214L]|uniref:glutathione S-transferase family protein n=1 Tax=Gilvimarinus sp. DZF01 TaxID=3461371 RepID=UPI004045D174